MPVHPCHTGDGARILKAMRATLLAVLMTVVLAGCMTTPPPDRFIVFFNFDSAQLSPEARVVVTQAADAARRTAQSPIQLAGYTGLEPNARTDDTLAAQRFRTVEEALVAAGVERARLSRVGLPEEAQLPATAVRRIEIRFMPQPQPQS
jgi:outer membrane protein OmpA-like peptidoglycan-associated protein